MTSPILGEFLGGTTGYAINQHATSACASRTRFSPSRSKEAPTVLTLRFPLLGHFSGGRSPVSSCMLFLSSKGVPAVRRDDLKTEGSEVTDDGRAGESWQSYPQTAFLESLTGHTLAGNKLWCSEFPATLICTPLRIGVENEIDKMDVHLRARNPHAHRQFRASPGSRKGTR